MSTMMLACATAHSIQRTRAIDPSRLLEHTKNPRWAIAIRHFFGRARANHPSSFVPSAREGTGTMFTPASRNSYTERPPVLLPRGRTTNSSSFAKMGTPSVYHGRQGDARRGTQVHDRSNISAPYAENQPTELSRALESRKQRMQTPFEVDAWESALSRLCLTDEYGDVAGMLRSGARAGIPRIDRTFTPQNSKTVSDNREAFEALLRREFETGRLIGPYSAEELERHIGPFQSSPITLVAKPHAQSVKYRLVHNLSYPYHPRVIAPSQHITSINYSIDSDNFPCTWGTFIAVALLISCLPPGSEGAVRDVKEAYRTVPLAFDELPGAVIRLSEEDQFAINFALLIGLASAGGLWGLLADAFCAILRAEGIGPLSKWVDDFLFLRILLHHLEKFNDKQREWHARIKSMGGRRQHNSRLWFAGGPLGDDIIEEFDNDFRYPITPQKPAQPTSSNDGADDQRYTYSLADVDRISAPLGIPWAPEKEIPFGPTPIYIGFIWDLERRTVGIPEKKKKKYRDAIDSWHDAAGRLLPQTLKDVQKLYGKLLHACHIVPAGRAWLCSLEQFMPVFRDDPDMPRHPPKFTRRDLAWWTERLSYPRLERPLPGAVELIDIQAFSDASSGVGIGIVIGHAWRAWKLRPSWRNEKRDIKWIEALGFELLIRVVVTMVPTGSHVKVYGDNKAVVDGWKIGRSRDKEVNAVFQRVHGVCEDVQDFVHARYVQGKQNPADAPSRGMYPKGPLLPIPAMPAAVTEHLELVSEDKIKLSAGKPIPGSLPKSPNPASQGEEDLALDEIGIAINEHSAIWDD